MFFKTKMQPIKYWKNNSEFHDAEYKLNSRLAEVVSGKNDINKLSEAYTHINSESIYKFLNNIPNIKNVFKGDGIDLGGGPGIVSATLVNNYSDIESLILLEYVSEVLELCYPITHKYLLKDNGIKISPICGSFDQILLEDKSIDFAIFWGSLHHSLDPIKTLKEVNRVLKSSGHLVIVDRAHDNSTPQKEIDRMMNIVYSQEFIRNNFLPEGTILTRKDNGEHEYRFNELEDFFKESNFNIIYEALFIQNHPRNLNYINDAGIKQFLLDMELGGFEKRKIVYILKPI